MYLTTTISVSLVLLLLGLLSILLLATHSIVDRIRENVSINIVLNDQADSTSIAHMSSMLSHSAYCKDYQYISKEQALSEHIAALGEDPEQFLGYNPLNASYEVHPVAAYAHPDSISTLEKEWEKLPYVGQVIYQKDMLQLLNKNLSKAAIGLSIVAIIMLLIALTLIVNTIRLQIYSKRFLIRTMTLVGATPWMIKAPFIRTNIIIGLAASTIAIAILSAAVYYVTVRLGVLLFAITWQNISLLVVTIVLSGVLITTLAALFSTGRYIRMNADTLYRI